MVYVDNYNAPYGRMVMCHMMADSLDELHAMATAIGLKREWFQTPERFPHYDVSLSMKAKALKLGAIECTARELVERFPYPAMVLIRRGYTLVATSGFNKHVVSKETGEILFTGTKYQIDKWAMELHRRPVVPLLALPC